MSCGLRHSISPYIGEPEDDPIAETPPAGAVQAFDNSIDVKLEVAAADTPESKFYTLQLKVVGKFIMTEGEAASLEEIAADGHCFSRMLFPVTRSEIVRGLARAKVPDLSLAWDIGPANQTTLAAKN